MKLHAAYTQWYAILLPLALLSDLMGWNGATATLLGGAAVVELVAVFIRRKGGDSWSEHNWGLTAKYPAFMPISVAHVIWLVWTALKLFPATAPAIAATKYEWGLIAMGVGVLWWAIDHMVNRGRRG